jgi:hypothetical protein
MSEPGKHEIELEELRAEIMLDAERIRARDTTIRELKYRIKTLHIMYLCALSIAAVWVMWLAGDELRRQGGVVAHHANAGK